MSRNVWAFIIKKYIKIIFGTFNDSGQVIMFESQQTDNTVRYLLTSMLLFFHKSQYWNNYNATLQVHR